MEETGNKISLLDLLSVNTKVQKKIITINSSLYEDDAFEYLLRLVDENESIAFVTDRKQIYTHGTWFGSDIWEDTVKAFSGFDIVNADSSVSSIKANDIDSVIGITGENGIELSVEQQKLTRKNILHIKYNVDSIIDNDNYVNIDNDNFTLGDENNKMFIKKHTYENVHLSEPDTLEYDKPDTNVQIKIYVDDIEKFTLENIFTDNAISIEYNENTNTIDALIKSNVDTKIGIEYYYDGSKFKTSVIQRWGYKWYHGTEEMNLSNFNLYSTEIEPEFVEKTIKLNQLLGEYGYFVYPKMYDIVFIDSDSSIAGGWKKIGKFVKYSKNIEYQIYRTSNAGLGDVTWHITKKQN